MAQDPASTLADLIKETSPDLLIILEGGHCIHLDSKPEVKLTSILIYNKDTNSAEIFAQGESPDGFLSMPSGAYTAR